ncbi:alginate lyase family protein [Halobacillus rhizosphaerae]|uniref:alginate lyase family protein n=1 Tax=Halobacillus rhizosphaerae TaxID=3064889 RepID=UPI00398B4A31
MAEEKSSRFFYQAQQRPFIKEMCEKNWGREVEEVLERADLACENTFIFTHRWDMERCETPVSFGGEVDWTYRYNGDFEWTVNLNRARFMAELGQAYWLTDDEKYASSFIRLLKDWVEHNPLTLEDVRQSKATQYNVKDTWRKLDSGIRITNWIKGYFCVRESHLWGEKEEMIFGDAVHMHGQYLSMAYTPHDQQSNWGFLETNGLFQISVLFPQFSEAKSWQEQAISRLEAMCRLQVFSDGMHNEQSPMYHHEVLHCLFESILLSEVNEMPMPEELKRTLEKMYHASFALIKPNGNQPRLSDSDDTDIRDVLTRGAALFQRGDWKCKGYKGLDYEGIWYFGEKGLSDYSALLTLSPAFGSIHLENSGYSVLRNNWSSKGHYLLFDGGHMDIIRAHGHDDFLHIDLTLFGKEFLVDPGRYTYMENEERKYFKESFQHNTTSVDNHSISSYVDSWHWDQVANITQPYWRTSDAFDFVQAGHDGYWKLDDPVQVLRQIFYVKPDYYILIDRFLSREEHVYTQHFHLDEHAELRVLKEGEEVLIEREEGEKLSMIWLDPVQLSKEESWVSRHYNQKRQAVKLTASKTGKGVTTFITALLPRSSEEEGPFSMRKIDVFSTRYEKLTDYEVTALEVKRGDREEIVVFSHQGPFSYQFADTQMTGEVLFLKKDTNSEQSWVVKT